MQCYTAVQNEVALIYHEVRELYFLADVFEATIVSFEVVNIVINIDIFQYLVSTMVDNSIPGVPPAAQKNGTPSFIEFLIW